jgi:hypothetical protein
MTGIGPAVRCPRVGGARQFGAIRQQPGNSPNVGLRGGPQRTRTACQAPSHIERVSET